MDNSAGTSPERRVRVFVINDAPIFLEALRRFFLLETWIEQVGSTVMTADVLEAAARAQPHVLILEPGYQRSRLPDIIGQFRARLPGIRIIVLTLEPGTFPQADHIDLNAVTPDWAIAAGADAFVAKEHTADDLLEAVRRLAPS